VPRTRTDATREQKYDALLDAADALFRVNGFDGTSTARVARAAGVSERTLYWYTPSKDHLLVAVVERGAERIRAALAARDWPSGDPFEDFVAVLQEMRSLRHVIPALHQRAGVSELVATARAEIRAGTDRAIAVMLRQLGVGEGRIAASTDVVECFVDGSLLRNLDGPDLDRACRTLIEGLTAR